MDVLEGIVKYASREYDSSSKEPSTKESCAETLSNGGEGASEEETKTEALFGSRVLTFLILLADCLLAISLTLCCY